MSCSFQGANHHDFRLQFVHLPFESCVPVFLFLHDHFNGPVEPLYSRKVANEGKLMEKLEDDELQSHQDLEEKECSVGRNTL